VAIGIALQLAASVDEWLRCDQLRHAAVIDGSSGHPERLNCVETGDWAKDTDILQGPVAQFGKLSPNGDMTLRSFEELTRRSYIPHSTPPFRELQIKSPRALEM